MLEAILQEIALQKDFLQDKKISTIYLGGGTPSVLSAIEINRITEAIARLFDINDLQEFTIETNPDDLTLPYIQSLRGTSVNRFSIGVQSFFDEDLQYMNRAHNAQEADYAIKAAQDAGFTNITADLIYGTPGLTDKKWKQNIQTIQKLNIPHLSAYALTVEEGTALHHNIAHKKAAPVDAAQAAQQFEILMDEAERIGFEHYEISNFAKEGHRAVHNTNYWTGIPYLGIGPSAHAYDGEIRKWNIANNALYMKSILTEKKLNFEEETLTPEQSLNEYIMTSLRTVWGLDINHVQTKWGAEYSGQIKQLATGFIEKKQAVLQDNVITLTKQGKLFADNIAADLFF